MSTLTADPVSTVQTLLDEANRCKVKDKEKAFGLANEALTLAVSANRNDLILEARVIIAYYHHHTNDPENFFKEIFNCIDLSMELEDRIAYAYCKYLSACCYRNLGDYSNSAENFLESLAIGEEHDHLEGIIRSLNGLGGLHTILGNTDKALDYFSRGLLHAESLGVNDQLAHLLGNQAEAFIKLNKYDEATFNLTKVLDIYEKLDDPGGVGVTHFRIAKLHLAKGDHEKGIGLLKDVMENGARNHSKIAISVVGNELARVLVELGRFDEAHPYLQESYEVSKQIGQQQVLNDLYLLKYKIALHKGDYKEALHFHELYHEHTQASINKDAELKLKNAESLTEIKLVKKEAEINRLKHVELKKAYEEIEEKNKEITDSIHYSRRIQRTILPSEELLEKNFADYFVMFQPRNIVSGDFYWFVPSINGNCELKIVAVADCTGHGVPGALMSMIGYTLLNQIVVGENVTSPELILEELDRDLCAALKVHSGESRDGMDISICLYNECTRELLYSSAMRPAFIYEQTTQTLKEVKGTKRSIGSSQPNRFELNTFKLAAGDRVFLFTDGYSDQFGGERGKKLMLKNFKQHVLSTSQLETKEQGKKLCKFFNEWKGDHEQVDDVTVLCFAVK
jgi:serine phosphatase RsbU (regulator of sigma subunit)